MSTLQRKLATIREVYKVIPIEGADSIEKIIVDGWPVVVRKGEFKEGDKIVYFEIDSLLPLNIPSFSFLSARAGKVYKNSAGEDCARLRTIKLRGAVSQGLAITMKEYDEALSYLGAFGSDSIGEDVTDIFGIEKWEPILPTSLSGLVRGTFPSFIQKTDQERAQNIKKKIFVENLDTRYEVSVKMDGTSCTMYVVKETDDNGVPVMRLGVASRNMDLKLEDRENTYVQMFFNTGMDKALTAFYDEYGNEDGFVGVAIQGEIMGPGIQGNNEGLAEKEFFVFDVFDIKNQRYIDPGARYSLMRFLHDKGYSGRHVPAIIGGVTLKDLGISNIDELIEYADGGSLYGEMREGLVFKSVDGQFSFKVISNKYLLAEE